MELPLNYELNTRKQLIEAECPTMLLIIFNFVFSPMVQHLMHELDSKFNGNMGEKLIPGHYY